MNINKPRGMTSHDVVAAIRRLYPNLKVGHAGTLDPLATGVLLVLVGQATKRQAELMSLEKEYAAQIILGRKSPTDDLEGRLVTTATQAELAKINKVLIKNVLKEFIGEITQTVPAYSAVKVGGKKLYELARRGQLAGVKLPRRKVFIKQIDLLEFIPADKNKTSSGFPRVKLRVVCGRGTYLRSLARDLGEKLGVGAVLAELTRTRIGSCRLEDAREIGKINDLKSVPDAQR